MVFTVGDFDLRYVDAGRPPGVILADLQRLRPRGVAMTARHMLRGWLTVVAFGFACCVAHAETTGAPSEAAAADFRTVFRDSLTAMPDPGTLSVKGGVYVPAYSRIYGAAAGDRRLIELSTTLRINNTSSTKPLVLERIEYFDTAGKLVHSYLSEPVALRPFGAIEIVIPAEDDRGGVAANFIVEWAGSGPIAEPLVEAVMIGSQDNTSYSFVSPGRRIRNLGRSSWPSFRFKF